MESVATHRSELDSLRGLAALAVLMEHTVLVFQWPVLLPWLKWPVVNMLFDGSAAVTIFFVLSGLVLSLPQVALGSSGKPRPMHLRSFYVRRVTRVWLPWLCIFVVSLLVKVMLFSPVDTTPPASMWLQRFWRADVTLRDVALQCFYALNDATRQLLPQDWSLGVELKASLLIPMFVWMVNRNPWMLWATGIALLVVLPKGQYYVSFVLGVLLARHFDRLQAWARRLRTRQWAMLLAVGVVLYQARLLLEPNLGAPAGLEKIIWTLTSVGSVVLIVVCLHNLRISRWLHLPPILFLGRISYSVYLVQFIVLVWWVPVLVSRLNAAGVSEFAPVFAAAFVVSISTTLMLAWLSYCWIEVPSIRLGRRLSQWLERSACVREQAAH